MFYSVVAEIGRSSRLSSFKETRSNLSSLYQLYTVIKLEASSNYNAKVADEDNILQTINKTQKVIIIRFLICRFGRANDENYWKIWRTDTKGQ